MPDFLRVGIDLDNTIVGYDRLFRDIASDRGWLPQGFAGTKKELRDFLRTLPNGEAKWMLLQAEAYGPRMRDADLIEGVETFLCRCRSGHVGVSIVSHKTQFAAADPGGADLHEAAKSWLEDRGFFANSGYGVSRDRVFFERTRADKCRRIAVEGCTHFIDDLEEVFLDPAFPDKIARYLFLASGKANMAGSYRVHRNWSTIADDILIPLGA